MPKKRYNTEQETLRRRVQAAHRAYIEAKLDVEERVRVEVEDRLRTLRLAESVAANEALAAGVTNTDIIGALGIGNWHTYKGILAMTEAQFVEKKDTAAGRDWIIQHNEEGVPVGVTFFHWVDRERQPAEGEEFVALRQLADGEWRLDIHSDFMRKKCFSGYFWEANTEIAALLKEEAA